MVRSIKWKSSFFVHFQVHLLIGREFIMQSDIAPYPLYLLLSCVMASFMAFPCSSQKLPSNSGECMLVIMFTFHQFFHTLAVKLPSPQSLDHHSSFSFFLQNSSASIFCLVEQSHSRVSSQCVNRQMMLEVERNCPSTTCVQHVQSLQQVLSHLHVQLSWKESHVSCLCLNTQSYCKYNPQNHTAYRA